MRLMVVIMLAWIVSVVPTAESAELPLSVKEFLQKHCVVCHDADTKKADLDLDQLQPNFADSLVFARWVKVYDRVRLGEMPPKRSERPTPLETNLVLSWLKPALLSAEKARISDDGKAVARRLTRAEYEHTMRDLFDLPGVLLQTDLPADGSAHGFDKHHEALDISHVNLAKYVEAADKVLDAAIVARPKAPSVEKQRVSLAETYIVRVVLMQSDAVLLRNGQPDPHLPFAGQHQHLGLREHEQLDLLTPTSTVGIFRHEDDAFDPSFRAFAAVFGGRYRFRVSLWSFGWDKGKVVPARGIESVRLSAVQLQNNGHGGGHPSFPIGYFDAPPDKPKVHEFVQWLNPREEIGFNAASLVPRRVSEEQGRTQNYKGPGVACDWLEVEGPIYDQWPPRGHRLLFGDLPIVEFKPQDSPRTRFPDRKPARQEIIGAKNQPEPFNGMWSVRSKQPLIDADRLLASFLAKAFRRPVSDAVRKDYVALVRDRLRAGDCFELAMRWAYRAALCSPDFLYHIEPATQIDNYAIASRLSYLFWNSLPDQELTQLAISGKLNNPNGLRQQTERLLRDPKSQRFIEDFVGQWLKLRLIAANDPDKTLYPEFSPYLQDSMVAETRAYFRELLDQNLDVAHLAKSNFAMLNEALAKHYGLDSVKGTQIRRVALPANCPRGGFLTHAAVLKVTANGTTTSPVPRGAFVMDRILGQPPEPPPPNVPAVEPDVRGATTIREMLDKHRNNATCASCHTKIDPPGFALESFDVIGGYRTRYRSIGQGQSAERGLIDPFVNLSFKLGPVVNSSGEMADGRKFASIREFQNLIAVNRTLLLTNLTRQLAVYATGREIAFRDRETIAAIVSKTERQGGGIRTLVHELIQSPLVLTR